MKIKKKKEEERKSEKERVKWVFLPDKANKYSLG